MEPSSSYLGRVGEEVESIFHRLRSLPIGLKRQSSQSDAAELGARCRAAPPRAAAARSTGHRERRLQEVRSQPSGLSPSRRVITFGGMRRRSLGVLSV